MKRLAAQHAMPTSRPLPRPMKSFRLPSQQKLSMVRVHVVHRGTPLVHVVTHCHRNCLLPVSLTLACATFRRRHAQSNDRCSSAVIAFTTASRCRFVKSGHIPLSKIDWIEVVSMWTTKLLKLASLSLALMACESALYPPKLGGCELALSSRLRFIPRCGTQRQLDRLSCGAFMGYPTFDWRRSQTRRGRDMGTVLAALGSGVVGFVLESLATFVLWMKSKDKDFKRGYIELAGNCYQLQLMDPTTVSPSSDFTPILRDAGSGA
jgi:hypothetical protein